MGHFGPYIVFEYPISIPDVLDVHQALILFLRLFNESLSDRGDVAALGAVQGIGIW